ncbi:hypothetical protein D0962_11095 [Leptolyngbyaceae cyanobacterium CCMR0082]|uniref:Uncharacterized protein n=2 Tax=Adonisia turfae TaxID=2950184 RepID=A0A6M0S493_9CYAN|nr:hypothetical protein [Adonisia turfae]MDV3350472.1 hypothetical protein [Leptothoe sp. LEGE 181152]NEZ55695.1 hypothetical protein [Adonisia turfae CCMR0081]NEZ63324.1 hypothetical protein [Adonisia turfae CCMR0082]
MDIQKRITRQRVNHIVDIYQLDGNDGDTFADYLAKLVETYPQSLIELALTEALVKGWSKVPMQKGMSFIYDVHERLRTWQPDPESSPQLPSAFKPPHAKSLGVTSLDVKTVQPSSIDPASIDVKLTPSQFEQITGLDASLVFNEEDQIFLTPPMGTIKSLEQR